MTALAPPATAPAAPAEGLADVPAIEARGVEKRYRRTAERTLLGALRGRSRPAELAAVADLDLRIGRGETVGVLGHNGAGKTTLLRLLAGVTAPSRGSVRVAGRVAPLISIGVGFHPELSGRENVYVNGSVLGLSRARIAELEDDIVAFSGLTGVLDTPVKFYSSGMLLRLAFSVAVHTEPDVMLVDELLAVGDVAFQRRCLDRMAEIRRRGTTVVLVSHSVFTIREVCDRALVMSGGRKAFDGPVGEAVEVHQRLLGADHGEGEAPVAIASRAVVDADDRPTAELRPGDRYRLRARLDVRAPVADPHVMFTAYAEDGAIAYQMLSAVRLRYRSFGPGERVPVEVAFTAALRPGTYQLTLQVLGDQGRHVYAHDVEGVVVRVAGDDDGARGPTPLGATVTARRRPDRVRGGG